MQGRVTGTFITTSARSVRRTPMATAADVKQYLKTVDFPAGKDTIAYEAQMAGAPEDVIKALKAMPPVDYANKEEVLRSAHTEP
jgi:hypothetical protein